MGGRFNVRVYGICISNGQLLVNDELIRGQNVIKLPGGGLDFGEGTIDGLKREWQEELGIEITVRGHFYTTDFFQASAFDDSQVISIYYFVAGMVPDVIVNLVPEERTYWVDLKDVSADLFTLPIDKKVGAMLGELYPHGTL